jgi:hypothetical protein
MTSKLALPGAQTVPRSGSLRLRVRAEQPVKEHYHFALLVNS